MRVGLGRLLLFCGGQVQAFVPRSLPCLPSAAPMACPRRHCSMSGDATPATPSVMYMVYTGDLRISSKPPQPVALFQDELLAEQDAVERTLLWMGGRGLASAAGSHPDSRGLFLQILWRRLQAGEVGTVAEVRNLIRRERDVEICREFRERLAAAQDLGTGSIPRRFWAVSRLDVTTGGSEGMGPESDGEVLTLEAMKAALKGGQSL
jgi:hypothetical protein